MSPAKRLSVQETVELKVWGPSSPNSMREKPIRALSCSPPDPCLRSWWLAGSARG